MVYKIAIASSDGESVNQHFGQAENFLIYEISDGKIEFIEDREVASACSGNECSHNDANFEILVELLKDCKAVFALKVGERAAKYLLVYGIQNFSVDYSLNHIFETLLKRQKGRVRIL
jgi:nitrogen fixation protein NifX